MRSRFSAVLRQAPKPVEVGSFRGAPAGTNGAPSGRAACRLVQQSDQLLSIAARTSPLTGLPPPGLGASWVDTPLLGKTPCYRPRWPHMVAIGDHLTYVHHLEQVCRKGGAAWKPTQTELIRPATERRERLGFTSLQEDILDRLAEAEHHPIWEQLRSAAQQPASTKPVEPRVLLEHIDRLSKEYGSAGLTRHPGARSRSSVGLLLAIEKNLKKQAESSAEIIEIERELSRACIEYRRAGELHRGTISVVRTHVQGVLDSCDRLATRISRHSEHMPEELEKARAWALENLRQCTLVERVLSSIENLWGQFEARRLRMRLEYRPRLAEVGRLQLAEEQERQVTRDYDGHARINAVAGTGKSVVLVHKAIRLFAAHGEPQVLLATPTDSLAEELRQAVFSLTGLEGTDGRLQVKSIPEILREWGHQRGETVQILDSDSAMISWEGFIDAADRNPGHPLRVGSSPDFLRELNTRLQKHSRASVGVASWTNVKRRFWLDFSRALNYLRDELDWIVSGLLPGQYDR